MSVSLSNRLARRAATITVAGLLCAGASGVVAGDADAAPALRACNLGISYTPAGTADGSTVHEKAGTTVKFVYTVTPKVPGAPLTVKFDRLVNGNWVDVSTRTTKFNQLGRAFSKLAGAKNGIYSGEIDMPQNRVCYAQNAITPFFVFQK